MAAQIAGIEDHDVESPPLGDRDADRALDLAGHGEVGRGREAFARARELGGRALEFGARARDQADRRSLGRERVGDREAQSAAPAGDQRHLAGEPHRSSSAGAMPWSRSERSTIGRSQGRPSACQ